jgi:hypothetical protein
LIDWIEWKRNTEILRCEVFGLEWVSKMFLEARSRWTMLNLKIKTLDENLREVTLCICVCFCFFKWCVCIHLTFN